MNPPLAMFGKLSGRKSRLQRRKTAVASRWGSVRGLRLEPLEQRQLLSLTIPLLNSDFQSPTWVYNGSSWVQQAVAAGTQPWNSNDLDPRFGPPGWAKTAQGGGGPGPNGEGIYGERNDLGDDLYFDYANGQLPTPASGVNFFCLDPAPGGTYNFWVDQQPDTTVDAGNHSDLNYPPMIAATTAQTGETYQATVALGNPLFNSGGSFPDVELDITLGAGTYYEPSNTNSYNYATGQTVSPRPGDTWLDYEGYGATVASVQTNDPNWVTPGHFQDLSVSWACPAADDGQPLDVMIVYHDTTQTTCMSNLQLNDITTLPAAPTGLIAAGASTSQVNVSWSDNATNVTGFQIDQSTSPDFSTGVTTATVNFPATSYSATGLSAGATYYYRVRAYNGAGDSVNTSTVSATTGSPGTPVAIAVPDGGFASDGTGDCVDAGGANGGGGTFTQPMTGALAGWSLSATPSTASGGYYSSGGWNPFGVLDTVTSSGASPYGTNAPWLGNQPGSTYNALIYYPGEQYAYGGVAGGPQPGASLTMTTTGINATAAAGDTYTATIEYGNVSWSSCSANPSANIQFNILVNGVVVSSAGLSGLDQGSPWTPLTVGWVADAAHAGQAIQLQVAATNFLEGPSSTQQWEVPTFAFADATLTDTAPADLPAAPSGLTATAASSSEIDLSWTNNAANQTGFTIDQATNSDFTQGLTTVTVAANVTTYSETGLSSNTTYYYRVRATNANGDSANTSTASATTQNTIPAAPSGLTATAISSSEIDLSWTNNAANQTGFKIDQAASSDFTQGLTTVTVGANATTYSATGLSAGATYYYRVRATNAVGDSANTSTASATTPATSVIPIPDGSFEQAALGTCTSVPSGGSATLTAPVTGSIPGWNLSYTPTTYSGGTYLGWVPYFGVFPSSAYPNPGVNRSEYDEITSEDGAQHLSLFGGELFNNYPANFGWQPYGIIPGQTCTVSSAQSLATTVAGATYTATIAVAEPHVALRRPELD